MGKVLDDPKLKFASLKEWHAWLKVNHTQTTGVLLMLAKKDSGVTTVTNVEAIEGALCWGWIDSVRYGHDETYFLQRFSKRTSKSPWSKINVDKVEALLAAGKIKPPGLAEIEKAKADGRWDRAYHGAKTAVVPDDLLKALKAKPRAAALFAELDATNRYAILFRLQTAMKPETRQARLEKFVTMLAKGETLYPRKKAKT